ncbi:DNA topoisomerase III [Chengkuizengella axinellae]|uniref:DNA topoisomerase 3 n=1 Tax=Chengkuizengella axinellae TaxID=3064388 RepID=A0ABT9J1E0_9BACL|nr:DNA topoisomerase III [Chengkuizengella sp. 2205SS18-9]MDP5275436.1 DNA topoisomerase III [Chengkuizengella sp. 2205SS18-9]
MKTIVLAEKPSVGRDIARVLNCNKKGNGFFEGNHYIVTWALGHLVTLADPESYEDKYKSWRIEDLPMLPQKLKLVVIRNTSKQFQTVKKQMTRKDVKDIVIATDAGREGELVARWIIEKAHCRKPVHRLWISSVTDKAIKDGFKQLKPGKQYENLYSSASARAEADWVVGINGTRALTCKFNAQLSCGRVQTPTLSMISKREEEITSFKPKTFYGIKSVVQPSVTFTWQDIKTKEIRLFDESQIDRILSSIRNQSLVIQEVKKTPKKSFAPALYDLTELQRDANRLFGYSAKETLSIMQRLYETHKYLTYPRTDSRFLSSDIVDTLKDRIRACSVSSYKEVTSNLLNANIKPNKSFVDNSKVSDHHAIIPTEQKVNLRDLNDKELKIYDLVVKRFLAVLSPPMEFEQTIVRAVIGEQLFIAKGKRVISPGWKEVYGKSPNDELDEDGKNEQDQSLPTFQKGQKLEVLQMKKTEGETKPPEFFTEGTLLSAMENPQKYMDAESGKSSLARTLGETGGLGTVATRADIIEKLLGTFLIEKRGKYLNITSKGKQLLELVPEDLKSPALTAKWEQKLTAISKGKLSKQTFVQDMRGYAKQIVSEIKQSEQKFKHDNMTTTRCPECEKPMLAVNGKKGKMLVCQDRECGHRKNVARTTNARCPQCKKKMELRGEGEGQIFVCSCNYREKLSSFQQRKEKEKQGKASKRDVAQYMKKQNKKDDEPMNTALADALAKLKLK